jgi:hypothetical protein
VVELGVEVRRGLGLRVARTYGGTELGPQEAPPLAQARGSLQPRQQARPRCGQAPPPTRPAPPPVHDAVPVAVHHLKQLVRARPQVGMVVLKFLGAGGGRRGGRGRVGGWVGGWVRTPQARSWQAGGRWGLCARPAWSCPAFLRRPPSPAASHLLRHRGLVVLGAPAAL